MAGGKQQGEPTAHAESDHADLASAPFPLGQPCASGFDVGEESSLSGSRIPDEGKGRRRPSRRGETDRALQPGILRSLVVLFISITLAGWRRPLGLRFRTTGQHHT